MFLFFQGSPSSKKVLFDVIAQNKAVLPNQLTHFVMFLTLLVLIIYLVILTFVTRLMLFQQVKKQVHG